MQGAVCCPQCHHRSPCRCEQRQEREAQLPRFFGVISDSAVGLQPRWRRRAAAAAAAWRVGTTEPKTGDNVSLSHTRAIIRTRPDDERLTGVQRRLGGDRAKSALITVTGRMDK